MKNTEEQKPDTINTNDNSQRNNRYDQEMRVKISPATIAFLSLLGIFILYYFGGGLLSIVLLNADIKNNDINAVRLLNSAGQILLMLLPALLLTKAFYIDITKILRFHAPKFMDLFLFSVGLIILSIILQSYMFIQNYFWIRLAASNHFFGELKSLLDQLDRMTSEIYSLLLASNSLLELGIIIFVVAITPAVCEEIFFRGFIQKSFELKYKPLTGAIITAAFFMLYHINPYQALPLFGLGLYFGFAVYKSNSIFTTIWLHFLNNFIAIILVYIFGQESMINDTTAAPDEIKSSIAVFSGMLIMFILLLVYINKFYFKREQKIQNSNYIE